MFVDIYVETLIQFALNFTQKVRIVLSAFYKLCCCKLFDALSRFALNRFGPTQCFRFYVEYYIH